MSHVLTTNDVLASSRYGCPEAYAVCSALSKVVVETWVDCCSVDRTPLGVDAPEYMDTRFEAILPFTFSYNFLLRTHGWVYGMLEETVRSPARLVGCSNVSGAMFRILRLTVQKGSRAGVVVFVKDERSECTRRRRRKRRKRGKRGNECGGGEGEDRSILVSTRLKRLKWGKAVAISSHSQKSSTQTTPSRKNSKWSSYPA